MPIYAAVDPETAMSELVQARLVQGVSREAIVHELSESFDYVMCALRLYVDGFVGAPPHDVAAPDEVAEPVDAEHAPMRSFRLSR